MLPEILAAKHTDKRARRVLETVNDILSIPDLAGSEESSSLVQELMFLLGKVPNYEATHRQVSHQDGPMLIATEN